MANATEVEFDAVKAAAAAEKAYAAAAEAVKAKAAPAAEVKPAPAAAPVAKQAVAPKAAVKTAKVAAPKAAPKTVVTKPVAKKVAAKTVKKAPAKRAAKATPTTSKLMEAIVAQTKKTQNVAEDFTARVKDAMSEAQDRAKAAFEKSQEVFGDYNEFAKGNFEALVESTKILAAGVQDLGKDYVANGKTVLETVTADVKELASVKSPTDFFKLQGEILRRNFDAAVAAGSKTSEKVVKVANEAFAPIQDRVSLAIEKVKQAA
jgi:phasin family protein